MRPASSRAFALSITVLCLLAALSSLDGLASAQAAAGSKHKLSQQSLVSQHPVASTAAKARAAKKTPAPPPLTSDTWNGTAGDGQWTTAGNWSAGVPSSSDAVTIGGTAAVTLASSQTGSFGTLTLSNSGDSVTVDNNALLEAYGNISNAGTITLSGTGNGTQLYLENSLTLSGGGTINLNTTNGQYTGLVTGAAGSVLTTSSNITGAGTVGNGELNFVNSGTINANISAQTLLVNPDTCPTCTNTNTGTLEATGGAQLTLSNGTWTQSGAGTITAAANSDVLLQSNVSITGGTLSTTGSGVIYNGASQAVFLTNVTNNGNYTIQNNGATEISGTLTNNGTITMDATGNVTELYLTGNTTLSGSGTVVLDSTNNQWTGYINGAGGTVLTNQSTITGWGTVGDGNVSVSNASNGVINSNLSGGNILLNPYTAVTSSNAGLLEATNGGTLTMSNGTWNNTGTIQAAAGSSVVLTSNVSITGGTLESTGTGTVINAASNNVFLTGLTLAGTYDIQNNAATEINGTITNNGVINLQGTGNTTELYVTTAGTGTATLAGSGSIVLGTGAGNQLNGAGGTSLIIDQNVSGVGNIGEGNLTLTNNSTINANISPTVSTASLYIQAGGGGMSNTKTLEATNGGTLILTGSTITNSSAGVIEAVGSDSSSNPSTVVLTGNTTIIGGTLTTSGAGVMEVATSNIANLTNLTNTGTLNVQNNGEILSTGTITNNGTITLQGGGNQTYFYAPNATVLTGTGTLVLGSTNNQYTGNVDGPGGFTNDETITGAGTIDTGVFVNNGTINANVSGQTLVLQSLSAGTANTKTMEATSGGTLELNGSSWNNAGGTITAGTNSAVDLTASVSITGGTLSTSGTGSQIFVAGSNVVSLTGLTNTGTLNVQNNGQIDSSGTITNNGTITLQASGNQTYFYSPVATTLTGTGTLVMGSTNGQYTGNVDVSTGLTNDETITGAGTLGGGTFINNGTVNANVGGQTLLMQSFSTATNTKTLEASGGGTMLFNGSAWTNTGGTIEAESGSAVNLQGSVSITGGTLTTSGTGAINLLNSNDAYLTSLTNSGTLNVQNNAQLNFTGTMTNSGTVNILGTGNTTYLIINGSVTLNGSGTIDLTSTNGQYTNAIYGAGTAPILISHNTIEGAGNLGSSNMGFTNDGTVDANVAGQNLAINVDSLGFTNWNGTTHTLTGGTYIANGGNITFASGGTTGITTLAASVTEENGGQILDTSNSNANALAGLTSITSTGALTIGGVAFTDSGSFSNAGSLTILSGENFKVGTLSQISGGTLTAGTYVLDANLNLTGATQNVTTNAATVTLAGGTIENANSTNALANLAANTGKLTLANNANFTTVGNFSNTGSLTVSGGSSFTLGGTGTLAQISGTTLSGGTFVLGGNLNVGSGINITTNSSTLTLDGGTIESGSTNALLNLASNTKSLTLAGNTNFTTTGNFSNTGTLTVNSGSTFTVLSGKSLTNYHNTGAEANTLVGGTYVVGGTLAFNAGTTGAIETDDASITLEGGGLIENTSAGAASNNALVNLASISSTGSFTLAENANFTAAGNFTNNNKLTIDSGSTFTLAGSNLLTNLASGTLTGGTYTVGGTLQLTSANGGITTNAANLTLTGTTAKILDGTTNALAGFNNNTGTFALASGATLTTASSNFTNSGTVTIAKGTTLTVPGAAHSYSQTAGTTTVDGTLAGIAGGASITGGTILGAGTIKGSLTAGNATGNAVTINVGDTGKAGLLSITGKYTQLATGNITGFINGTTVGTGYSQLKVTGTAALAGTINFTVSSAFQASLTVGETFTVLTASSVTGTFSDSTIAINSSFHFNVTYTATGVVLTVASGPIAPPSGPIAPAAQIAAAKPATGTSKSPVLTSGLRQRVVGTSGIAKPILVAGFGESTAHSNLILARTPELNNLRSWERVPVAPIIARPMALVHVPSAVNSPSLHNNVATPKVGLAESHSIGAPSTLAGWMHNSTNQRVPVKVMLPSLPRMTR
jgi:fibronectin-binding autotransporter adhesin